MSTQAGSTFMNPIMPGDYPDPSVVRVGEDYYMVASTFQFFPGVPVLHSRDLVHWETIGHVITRKEQMEYDGIPDSFGVFAPDISYFNGKFWVVGPYYHGQPRCTNIVYTSDLPEGPYSDGIALNHHFIDPSIFNDDNGKRYLAFGGGWLHELNEDAALLVGEAKQVWPGTGGAAPEAPHIVKRNGWYYLMLAEGGTFYDHMATIARSRSIWGPYEPCPHNPVLKQHDPNRRIQRAGHGKLVEDPDGNWWMVHLGGRPLTPNGFCPLGRETFLAAVEWTDDGWFTVGDHGAPQEEIRLKVASVPSQPQIVSGEATDRFHNGKLSPEWEWVRHPVSQGFELSESGLTIHCKPYIPYSTQSTLMLTRRWQHLAFTVEAELEFHSKTRGEEAGIMMYRDTDAFLLLTVRNGIGQTSGQMFNVKRLHENQEFDGLFLQVDLYEQLHRRTLCQHTLNLKPGEPIALRIELSREQGGVLHFSYIEDGISIRPIMLEQDLSAQFLYPESQQRFHCFTAPRTGIFARGVYGTDHGKAVFRRFTYRWEDRFHEHE